MRIQILELPRPTVEDDIPFAIVLSEYRGPAFTDAQRAEWNTFKENCGANALLATDLKVVIGEQNLPLEEIRATWPEPVGGWNKLTLQADKIVSAGEAVSRLTDYAADPRLVDIVAKLRYRAARNGAHRPTWEAVGTDIRRDWVYETETLLREENS